MTTPYTVRKLPLEFGQRGSAHKLAPTGYRFGIQWTDDCPADVAAGFASRILRVDQSRLLLIPGHSHVATIVVQERHGPSAMRGTWFLWQ